MATLSLIRDSTDRMRKLKIAPSMKEYSQRLKFLRPSPDLQGESLKRWGVFG